METKKIVYLSAVMVDEKYRGQGVASSIMQKIVNKENVNLIAARTQNPVMRESMKNICGKNLFPSLSNKEVPEEFLKIGLTIAKMLSMQEYDEKLMIGKRTYGASLYGKKIPALDKELTLNTIFWEMVNVQNGDSMVIVGKVIN